MLFLLNFGKAFETALKTTGMKQEDKDKAWSNFGIETGMGFIKSGVSVLSSFAGGGIGSNFAGSFVSGALSAVGNMGVDMAGMGIRRGAGLINDTEMRNGLISSGVSGGFNVVGSLATSAISNSKALQAGASPLNWLVNTGISELSGFTSSAVIAGIDSQGSGSNWTSSMSSYASSRYSNGSFWAGTAANFGATMVNSIVPGGDNAYGRSFATQGISRAFGLMGNAVGGVIDSGISGNWGSYGSNMMANLTGALDMNSMASQASIDWLNSGVRSVANDKWGKTNNANIMYEMAKGYMSMAGDKEGLQKILARKMMLGGTDGGAQTIGNDLHLSNGLMAGGTFEDAMNIAGVLSWEARRNGVDDGAEGQKAELERAARARIATSGNLMNMFGSSMLMGNGELMALMGSNYMGKLDSYLEDNYANDGDYWKVKKNGQIVWDGSKNINFEDGSESIIGDDSKSYAQNLTKYLTCKEYGYEDAKKYLEEKYQGKVVGNTWEFGKEIKKDSDLGKSILNTGSFLFNNFTIPGLVYNGVKNLGNYLYDQSLPKDASSIDEATGERYVILPDGTRKVIPMDSKIKYSIGQEGTGYKNYIGNGKNNDVFAQKEVVKLLQDISKDFNFWHGNKFPVLIGDTNTVGQNWTPYHLLFDGNNIPAYVEGALVLDHDTGLSVDLKYFTADGKVQTGNYNKDGSNYDENLTKELINKIINYDDRNLFQILTGQKKKIEVDYIIFADSKTWKSNPDLFWTNPVYTNAHKNHIHIEFKINNL